LFVKNHYQPFYVRTGGDALIKLTCSGLLGLLSIEVCYLRTWKRGKSFLFILYKHIAALIKQHSKVVTPQERLLSILKFFPRFFIV